MSDKTSKIKLFWNQAMSTYDHHMQETGHYAAQGKLLNELIDYFQSPILDLAAGPGFLTGKLLEKDYLVTSNDLSDEIFQFLSKRFSTNPHIDFSSQDASIFQSDKKFKTILCCNLFYYLENQEAAIKHWKNLLQVGGSIVLFEEFPFHKPSTESMQPYEKELMDLIRPISPNEIKDLFLKNGFVLKHEKHVPIDTNHDLYGFVFAV